MFEWGTVKNTVFHLIPWYGNFVERHSFHTRKLGEVTVLFVEYASHKYEIQQYYSKPILYQYSNYHTIFRFDNMSECFIRKTLSWHPESSPLR